MVTPTRSYMEQRRIRKMTPRVKSTRNGEHANSQEKKHRPTSLISRANLLQRLLRGKEARTRFVESHLDKSIAYQTRSLREKQGWTQAVFADKLGIKHQNNISARLENPNYGKHSLTTLKRIAASCDVALVVWFIPFSRFLDWVTGTPYEDNGLSEEFYSIPPFNDEFGSAETTPARLGRMEDQTCDEADETPLRFQPKSDLGSFTGAEAIGAGQMGQ